MGRSCAVRPLARELQYPVAAGGASAGFKVVEVEGIRQTQSLYKLHLFAFK